MKLYEEKGGFRTVTVLELIIRDALKEAIPEVEATYNARPKWLRGKDLDVYIESLNEAIEVDGLTHLFSAVRKKDEIKNLACKANGVKLRRVRGADDVGRLLKKLERDHPGVVTGEMSEKTKNALRGYGVSEAKSKNRKEGNESAMKVAMVERYGQHQRFMRGKPYTKKLAGDRVYRDRFEDDD